MTEERYPLYERTGYAYVPVQKFSEYFPPEEALERGTLFVELDLPISVYGPKVG